MYGCVFKFDFLLTTTFTVINSSCLLSSIEKTNNRSSHRVNLSRPAPGLLNPSTNVMLLNLPGFFNGIRISGVRKHQVQVVRTFRDDDSDETIAEGVQHTSPTPRIQFAIGEDNVTGSLYAATPPFNSGFIWRGSYSPLTSASNGWSQNMSRLPSLVNG
jgi:hypothetical protein